jgi:hypothetical protein
MRSVSPKRWTHKQPWSMFHTSYVTDGLINACCALLCCLCPAASGLPVLLKALNLLLPAADGTVLQASSTLTSGLHVNPAKAVVLAWRLSYVVSDFCWTCHGQSIYSQLGKSALQSKNSTTVARPHIHMSC